MNNRNHEEIRVCAETILNHLKDLPDSVTKAEIERYTMYILNANKRQMDESNKALNEKSNETLSKEDYRQALFAQSASNLSGIIHSFDKIITKISNEGFEQKKGTDWINRHPICRLFAEQIAHLTGSGMPSNTESWQKAMEIAETITSTKTAIQKTTWWCCGVEKSIDQSCSCGSKYEKE